jgi:hypothetical protein
VAAMLFRTAFKLNSFSNLVKLSGPSIMIKRVISFVFSFGILCLTTDAWAFGGAKIVVRQHGCFGGNPGGGFVNQLIPLANQVLPIVQNQLLGGASGLPPAITQPTANPQIAAVLTRLDALNNVPTAPNTISTIQGGAIPNAVGQTIPSTYPN